jgi:rhamnogalacturonan endolyase
MFLRWCNLAFLVLLLICAAQAGSPPVSEFGVVTNDDNYIVDTSAGLIFQVIRSNGSIHSIKFNGKELNHTKSSHIASGLGGGGTTTHADVRSDVAIITVETDDTNGVVKNLKQYYIVRKGENTIYMATYVGNPPAVGELRWITRLEGARFQNVPLESSLRGTTRSIESKDVFRMPDGTTRSKYYGNDRARDMLARGVTGPGCGVFMVYGNRESSSGGPFFRDIQTQSGSAVELYNYMNSGHNQTGHWRLGVLHGPYALCFTDGGKPQRPDMRFLDGLGLAGYVSESGRGSVSIAEIQSLDRNHRYTVAFDNPKAQYWTDVDPATGGALRAGMKPGSYMMTVFKGELDVHKEDVEVTAGGECRIEKIHIKDDPSLVPAVWRIGSWDGTPLEFRNGANITRMHPSDKRQRSWVPGTFRIGTHRNENFPACQWGAIGSAEIHFNLTKEQIADHVIRIGITAAFAAGRPMIQVNSWKPRNLPSPSSQPDSRSITIGTYRGNNAMYAQDVPASAFVAGRNVLRVHSISGQNGGGFLSPGYAFDCIDMCRADSQKP